MSGFNSDGFIPDAESSHDGFVPDQSETQPNASFADAAMSASKNLLSNVPAAVGKAISSPKNLYQSTGSYWPEAGAAAGTAINPGMGTAIGAGLGQITRNVAGIAYGDPNAPTTAMGAAAPAMVQTAVAGVPQTQGVKTLTQGIGRRALGFTKGMLKKMPGGVKQANEVAQTMLDKGVIGPGAEGTLQRAEALASKSGSAIGETLASAGEGALDAPAVADEVMTQLSPKYAGGAYDTQGRIAQEIKDTILAHGNGPIDFESAQALKNTLKDLAGNNWATDKGKAKMYQRAYGIVSDAIDKGLAKAAEAGKIAPSAVPEYLNNKRLYGATQQAITGINDKANAEAANSVVSLRGAAIGAGALASGQITPALEALGFWELSRRYGAGAIAPLLNKIYQQPTSMIGTAMAQKVADYVNQSYNK